MLWKLLMFSLYFNTIASFRIKNFFRRSFLSKMSEMRVENPNLYLAHDLKLPILYEDEYFMAINKPANIRSVPGVEIHRMTHKFGMNRCDEWIIATKQIIGRSSDPLFEELLLKISAQHNVPRRLDKFSKLLKTKYKVEDDRLIERIFNCIDEEDKALHYMKVEDMPLDLISAFDIAKHMAKVNMYIVHRLDMETSGVILFAKTVEASNELCRQFRDREIKKVYISKVANKVDKNIISVSLPVGPDENNRPVQIVDHVNGKDALTMVRVIDDPEEYALNNALFNDTNSNVTTVSGSDVAINRNYTADTTLVELRPHTGRTHQLRVHMSAIGHPMLGDTIYAPRDVIAGASRLCLHARAITLNHPITKEPMIIDSISDCKDVVIKKRKADSEIEDKDK